MSTVFAQLGLCITALITLAENDSPTEMSWEFSSDCLSKSGSSSANDGSFPAAASAKNWSILAIFLTFLASDGR